MEPKVLMEKIVDILEDKKGIDIRVMDISDSTIASDYFVTCSGTSNTHIKALAGEVEFKLKNEDDIRAKRKEGYDTAKWVLLDYGDVIVHVFDKEEREFYNLEKLWADGLIEPRT